MKSWDILYFSLIGICNFVILRECFTLGFAEAIAQNIRNARIRSGAFMCAIITLVGSILSRKTGFSPDWTASRTWLPAIGLPFVLAIILKSASDPGARSLNQGKRSWRSLSLSGDFINGKINPGASAFQDHPNIQAARNYIQEAITLASQSKLSPTEAKINEAVAYHELGLTYRIVNRFQDAATAFDSSLAILESLQETAGGNRRFLSAYRDTLFRLGELNYVMGDTLRAKERCEKSLGIDGRLGHNDPIGELATKQLMEKISNSLANPAPNTSLDRSGGSSTLN